MDLPNFSWPLSYEGEKYSRASKIPLYCLDDSYYIISLIFHFIMSGIAFIFVWFLESVLFGDL